MDKKKSKDKTKKPVRPTRKVVINDFIEHSHYGNSLRHQAYQAKNSRLVKTSKIPMSFEVLQKDVCNETRTGPDNFTCEKSYCEVASRLPVPMPKSDPENLDTTTKPDNANADAISEQVIVTNPQGTQETETTQALADLVPLCQTCEELILETQLTDLLELESSYIVGLDEIDKDEHIVASNYSRQEERKSVLRTAEKYVLKVGVDYTVDLGVFNEYVVLLGDLENRDYCMKALLKEKSQTNKVLKKTADNSSGQNEGMTLMEEVKQCEVIESSAMDKVLKPDAPKSILKKTSQLNGFRINVDLDRAVSPRRCQVLIRPRLEMTHSPITGMKNRRPTMRMGYQRQDADVYPTLRLEKNPIVKKMGEARSREYDLPRNRVETPDRS